MVLRKSTEGAVIDPWGCRLLAHHGEVDLGSDQAANCRNASFEALASTIIAALPKIRR